MMKKIITDILKYQIVQKYTKNIFLVEIPTSKDPVILKIISDKNHPFIMANIKINNPLQRSMQMAKLFSELDLSPKLIDAYIYHNTYLILIMPFIENELTEDSVKDIIIENNIKTKIERMHNLGIVHGDLHGANIRYGNDKKIYFIDTDTVFTISEYDNTNFPREWIKIGFEIDNLDEFIAYEKLNYMNIRS